MTEALAEAVCEAVDDVHFEIGALAGGNLARDQAESSNVAAVAVRLGCGRCAARLCRSAELLL